MADYWIKWYHEILDDPKMATLPDRLWRRFSELCLIAGKLGGNEKTGQLPDTRQLAWLLRMNTDDLQLDLIQLSRIDLIEAVPNGWLIPKFHERQSAVPGSERVRQHRERKQKQQYNGDVTIEKRFVTQNTETEQNITEGAEDENSPLSDAFTNATGIFPHSLDKWVKAEQELTAAKVTPDDVKNAVAKMDEDKLTYSGLWSVVNVAISVKSKRERQPAMSNWRMPSGV